MHKCAKYSCVYGSKWVKWKEKTNENFKKLYNGMMDEAMEEAEEHGVHVYRDIDKSAFIEAVQPIHEEFCGKGKDYQALYDDIQSYAEQGDEQ